MAFLHGVWNWTVNLGAWQVPLTLLVLVAGGACMIGARRLARPSMNESGVGGAAKTSVMVVAWIVGAVLGLYTLVCVAAVLQPLVAPMFG